MIKEQLMNYKEFGEHTDFVKKADELNTSGDLYYYDKRGIRTTDINDCLEWYSSSNRYNDIFGKKITIG